VGCATGCVAGCAGAGGLEGEEKLNSSIRGIEMLTVFFSINDKKQPNAITGLLFLV
jgi:hypothetical protein